MEIGQFYRSPAIADGRPADELACVHPDETRGHPGSRVPHAWVADGVSTIDAAASGLTLRAFYARQLAGRHVLLADDVRNTGQTFARCAALVQDAGGTVVATMEICDRLESLVDLGVPNIALVEYRASENYRAAECPMCRAGQAVTTF